MVQPDTTHEPPPTEPAPHFHTHQRTPAYNNGTTDANTTLTRHGTHRNTLETLLNTAWDNRNQAPVTSNSYDYWQAQLTTYRTTYGITPERDVDRHRKHCA